MPKDKRKKSERLTTEEAIDRVFGKHASRRLRAVVRRLDHNASAGNGSRKGGKKGKKKNKKKRKK